MCSTCSAGSADSASDSNAPECTPSPSASSIPTVDRCSHGTGPASAATPMCASSPQIDWLTTESAPSTSLPAASPARTFPWPAPVLVLQAHGPACGANSRDSFARLDPVTHSWRTWQRCWVEEWAPYSQTFPRSGMTRNGTAYALPTWGPRTAATEYGLWPTPTAGDAKASGSRSTPGSQAHPWVSLTDAVRQDGGRGRMVPTPMSRDHRSGKQRSRLARTGETSGDNLPQVIGGLLNPTWVEWLMGYPAEWTALKHSETRSSHRSPK